MIFYLSRQTSGAVWEHSSAGRASALQAEGHRFEPYCSHHLYGPVVQLVRTPACHAGGRRFEPDPGRHQMPLQLSWQSRGLKIPVSLVRFRSEAPYVRMQLIRQSATLPRWRQRVRASSSAVKRACRNNGRLFYTLWGAHAIILDFHELIDQIVHNMSS